MLQVFLKDRQQTVEFRSYPGDNAVKFLMNFKKIFPSVFDLLLPVLAEEQSELESITWESTSQDFDVFKKIVEEWATIEIRLNALTKFKNKDAANQVVRKAQDARKKYHHQSKRLNLVYDDFIFMLAVHSYLDIELLELGSSFYVPTFKKNWQHLMPVQLFNEKV